MIYGYFDDSAHFNDHDYLILAGYLADDVTWDKFSTQWAKVLNEGRISALHMKDFIASQGPYKNQGWSQTDKDDLLKKLVAVINDILWQGIGVAVDVRDYKALSSESRWRIGKPHLLCVRLLVDEVIEQLRIADYQAAIPMCFDDSEEFSIAIHGHMTELFKMQPHVREKINCLSFADDEWSNPLQAADVLAREIHKNLRRIAEGHISRKDYEALVQKSPIPYSGGIADADWFQRQLSYANGTNNRRTQ